MTTPRARVRVAKTRTRTGTRSARPSAKARRIAPAYSPAAAFSGVRSVSQNVVVVPGLIVAEARGWIKRGEIDDD